MSVVPWERLPRPVREIEHTWIELADGTRLAARIWLPEDAEARPGAGDPRVPPVPQARRHRRPRLGPPAVRRRARLRVGARRHPRHAASRTGSSRTSTPRRSRPTRVEVIAWLAAQPWCSGAVGMTGISWGGFNALQVAALRPPALRAIMTLCSTDDRYADDVHYRGGCVLATDMLHWASSMLTWNARPPDPLLLPDTWREVWLDRLERTPPYIEHWLAHQRRDDVLAARLGLRGLRARSRCRSTRSAAGSDGYTNAVFRLLAGLDVPRKGLVGPWAHAFPDDAAPGPSIGWLQECVRWWDQWLKGRETGIMDEPMLRAYVQESVEPRPSYDVRAGRWAGEEAWPSPRIERRSSRCRVAAPLVHRPAQTLGTEAGVWCAEGAVGRPRRRPAARRRALGLLRPRAARGAARAARLPRGRARARRRPAARARLRPPLRRLPRRHLGARHARAAQPRAPRPRTPSRSRSSRAAASASASSSTRAATPLPAGHRLRVAVSSTYWPWAWPSPEPVTLTLHGGTLELPVRPPRARGRRRCPRSPSRSTRRGSRPSRTTPRPTAARCGATTPPAGSSSASTTTSAAPSDSSRSTSSPRTRTNRLLDRRRRPALGGGLVPRGERDRARRAGAVAPRWRRRCAPTRRRSTSQTELTATESGAVVFARTWEHRFPRDHV